MGKTLIVITGPTAVGKTDLCMEIARQLDIPIINADSRQLFRELQIGTASPTADQLASVRHYFVGTLGIDDYDVCFVTLGRHFQTSLETTSLLSELGAKKVISRATNDVQMKFLLRNGADEVVYPEKQTAIRIATKYASDNILDFFHLEKEYYIYELKVPKDWYGKTLQQIDVRKKYNINILTLKRSGEVLIPSATTVIQTGDIAFVLGEFKDIQKALNKR